MQENNSPFTITQTGVGDEPFSEELHFSTADLEREQFWSDVKEYHLYSGEAAVGQEALKFRLIDGELFIVDEQGTPPNATPLREDAGILRIAKMQK